MNMKKIVAQAGIAGALGLGVFGLGTGFAHADQGAPPCPGPNCQGPGNPAPPGRGGPQPDDVRGPVQGDRDDFNSRAVPMDRDDTHGMWHSAPWGGDRHRGGGAARRTRTGTIPTSRRRERCGP